MRLVTSFLAVIVVVCVNGACHGAVNTIDECFMGGTMSLTGDTVVTHGGMVATDRINVDSSVLIVNHGIINSDIFICDGCDVYLRNTGNFSASVNFGEGAKLTQVITGADDITRLGLDSEFNILVRGSDTMSLGDIMSAGGYAAKITLDNSEFVWSRGVSHLRRAAPSPDIELRGTVVINVADVADVLDAPILQNVSGDGDVYVNAANLDSMYALRGYVDNGSLRVRMMRSTDYVRILGGAVGEFLNGLRVVAPDDKLLAGLDLAATRDELYSIMRRSVRLNPIKLMRPVGIINDMEIMRMGLPATGVSIGPVVVAGDDFGAYGLRAGAGGKIGRATRFEIFAYTSVADYSDDLNVFAATTYGGGARIKHSGENMVSYGSRDWGRLPGLTSGLFSTVLVQSTIRAAYPYIPRLTPGTSFIFMICCVLHLLLVFQ